ncbi:MAG: hypothetical protein SFY70_00190 [Bacteroidia bacterium]|nr:hypothetical protein [Bacteroidia bacterium]
MKLLILLGVEASEPILRQLFHASGVEVYSEFPIQGHRLPGMLPDPTNWFGTRTDGVYATMAFAFLSAEKATAVEEALAAHNRANPTAYPLHAFRLAVESAT